MSDAIAGVGAQFKRSNMLGTPTFTAIGEITDINGPNLKRDTYDTTSLDTTGGYRTFIGGFRDGGEVTLEMNFTLDGYDDMKSDFESDDLRDYQIVLPDTGATTLDFEALVTAIGVKIPTSDKVSSSVTVKISGPVTLTT
jgi:predicted secreted protein